jgi:uncharacterized protein (TIGR00369 family)
MTAPHPAPHPYDPATEGWRPVRDAPLPGGLGMPWAKRGETGWQYGLLTTDAHLNPAGVVHGGVLMTFADHAMSFLAWEAAERRNVATIQLNTQFLTAVPSGAFMIFDGRVTRRTRGLVFLHGTVSIAVDADPSLVVGAIDGIWRVLTAG